MRFDETYEEAVLLADGRAVVLRLLRPTDEHRALLREGFSRLSDRSRYLRFFSGKPRLTDAEVAYLTDTDGPNHLAIGALDETSEPVKGVGVARWLRLPDRPEAAEPAVTVVDEAQGLGLGTLLMRRLVEAAVEHGVQEFHAEFLGENEPVRAMLRDVAPDTIFRDDGDGVMVAEMPLPGARPHLASVGSTPVEALIRRVLKHHASIAKDLVHGTM